MKKIKRILPSWLVLILMLAVLVGNIVLVALIFQLHGWLFSAALIAYTAALCIAFGMLMRRLELKRLGVQLGVDETEIRRLIKQGRKLGKIDTDNK